MHILFINFTKCVDGRAFPALVLIKILKEFQKNCPILYLGNGKTKLPFGLFHIVKPTIFGKSMWSHYGSILMWIYLVNVQAWNVLGQDQTAALQSL